MIQKLKFGFLSHPVQILPHLITKFFGLFKYALNVCQFANNEVINYTVHTQLQTQLETFFTDGIMQLMN